MIDCLDLKPRDVSRRTWRLRHRSRWARRDAGPFSMGAFVQTAAIGSTSGATLVQTSAFAANPTVGNYLVAWAFGSGGSSGPTGITFSDSGSNSYTTPTNSFILQAVGGPFVSIAFAKVATSAASFKITAAPAPSGTREINVVAAEFSGVLSASPLDGAAGAGSSSTTGAGAPGSLAHKIGSLCVACMASSTGSNPATVTTPAGWTSVGQVTNGASFTVGDAIYAIRIGSPQNPTWNNLATFWAASQFALLATIPILVNVNQAVKRAGYF